MQRFRRLAFSAFVILYLILCPLTVLYALGYVLQPGEQRFVKTGLIALETSPAGASVYVGNRRYARQTPTTIRALLPGEYTVKILRKHYQPWVRTIQVESEKAMVFDHVLLIPQAWPRRALLPESWVQIGRVPGSHALLLSAGERLEDVFLYDVRQERSWPLLSADSPWRLHRVVAVTPMAEEPIVVIQTQSDDQQQLLWVDLRSKDARITPLNQVPLPLRGGDLRLAGTRQHLVYLSGSDLMRLEPEAGEPPHLVASRVRGFGVVQRRLYVLTEAGVCSRHDLEGQHAEVIAESPAMRLALASAQGVVTIAGASEEALVFHDEAGALWSVNPFEQIASRGFVGLEWSADRRRMLVWTRDAVGVVDWPERSEDEALLRRRPTVRWLLRGARSVTQAWWVYEDSHLVVQEGERLSLLEADTAAGQTSRIPLTDIVPRSHAAYLEETGTLYYVDATSRMLTAITLLADRAEAPSEHPTP